MSTPQDGLNPTIPSSADKASLSPLEVLADEDGSLAVGWLAHGVLYTRLMGGLSLGLGTAYVNRLQALIDQVPSLEYFCDAGALEFYDLMARGAFARLVLENRRKFSSLYVLTWVQGITDTTRAFSALLGEPCEILDDSWAFDRQLLRAAPQARKRLDSKTWVPIAPSTAR